MVDWADVYPETKQNSSDYGLRAVTYFCKLSFIGT